MARRNTRLKFIWGASGRVMARWRLGIWGFYERKQGYPDSGLVISVRGILVLSLVLAVLGYVSVATAVYHWLDRKEHNHVTYSDVLLLPIRWDEVQAKRGQTYLDGGMADMKNQRWGQGMMKLRIGLARYPKALNPRLTLAQIYHYSQRHELAMKVLEEGIDAFTEYPGRSYLQSYFRLAHQGEAYSSILTVCDRYLALEDLPEEEDLWLFQQKVAALRQAKRADEALALMKEAPDNRMFKEQRVLIMLEMGEADQALAYLKAWANTSGETEQILRLQVRANRDDKNIEAMNEGLMKLREMRRADPRLLAYAVIQQQLAGEAEMARASLDDFFFRFSGFPANMTMIAAPLAEIGAVELLRECLIRSEEQGYEMYPLLMNMAQAQIKASDWSGALATTGRLEKMSNPDKKNTAAEESVQKLSYLAQIALNPAEGLQVQLLQSIENRPYGFKVYRQFAETLLRANRYHAVLEVIARAERKYPQNNGLEPIKQEAGDALAALAAEKPVVIVFEERVVFVEGEFFKRLDVLMAEQEWTEAGEWVRQMQQARPSWMKSRETDILIKQIAIAHEARNVLEMTLAARLLLDGSLQRSQMLVDYAVELESSGELEDALRLMKAVSRKSPNHALSRRYLNEWTESSDTQNTSVEEQVVTP